MTYKPHKYQLEFHKSSKRFRTLIAGRRGGKSLSGTIESLYFANNNPGSLGYIVAPTYGMLKDVNIPMVFEWLPQSAIDSYNKVENRLVLKNGSEIRFRSGEKEDSLRGPGIDWIWLDEACFMDPYVWDVLLPALTDKGGVAWVTTTPQGYDWVYNRFYKPAMSGDPGYGAWTYKTVDNPYIDPELVEQARRDMSEQMFRQEYLATFEKFSGLVYPDFDEKKHTFSKEPVVEAPLYFVGIDVGYTNPTAALLVMEDEEHKLWVLDEWYHTEKTAPEIVEGVGGLVGDKRIENYLIDPASKGTQQTSEMSVYDQIIEAGLPVIPADNDVRGGINRVIQLFRNDGLMIHKRCVNLIRELNTYSWKEQKKDESNKDERPIKKDDHCADSLRYICYHRPDWYVRRERDRYGREIQYVGEGDFFSEDKKYDII